jgi:hypothetical protein
MAGDKLIRLVRGFMIFRIRGKTFASLFRKGAAQMEMAP